MAADEVCRYANAIPELRADLAHGKMLGVLVCRDNEGQMGFLAAYSGLLAGRNDWDYFVPPIFDAQQPDGHFKQTERKISAINDEVKKLEATQASSLQLPSVLQTRLQELRQQRREMSETLQRWLFSQYRVLNAHGEEADLVEVWRRYHQSERLQRRFPLPPGGSGDCCAPKLLQFAYRQDLHPLCMAEFWQGASPRMEIRHHGHYYPACRGKCKPILSFMLQGLDVEVTASVDTAATIEILHDDPSFFIIGKPAGLLSVPGRIEALSVESLLRQRFPEQGGPMMVHRLDMDTSGIMVVARTPAAYHSLQQQFLRHEVKKRYVALLQHALPADSQQEGRINLPLRPDPLDRPRQLVDFEHGKQAVTIYEVLSTEGGHPRLALMPLTGRTHQLRMHCAHPMGLGVPIMGDPLYGNPAARLYLHAERFSFHHPLTGESLVFSLPSPF